MLSALAFTVIAVPVAPPFNASLKAHSQLKSVSLAVDCATKTMRLNRSIKGTFQLQNGLRAKLSIQRNGKPYRWYLLDGTLFSGYDIVNDEYLSMRVTGKESQVAKFLSVVPDSEDSLRTVLDPDSLGKLYSKLKIVTGWKVKNKSVFYIDAPKSRLVVEFEPKTNYLKRFEMTGNGNQMRWNYKWGACGTVTKPSIPITAVKVSAFTGPKPPALYESESARLIARASVKAYGALSSADMEIRTNERTLVTMRRGKSVVKSPSYELRYDGKNVLIMVHASKKAFIGRSTMLGLQEAIAKSGCNVDAYALQVIARKNPMKRLLYGGMKVKEIGSAELDGQACDLLEIANADIRISVAIRKRDRLIASESATYLTSGAGAQTGSDRQISYESKSAPPAAFAIQAPRGYKTIRLK